MREGTTPGGGVVTRMTSSNLVLPYSASGRTGRANPQHEQRESGNTLK
jgi:hypothetical protein